MSQISIAIVLCFDSSCVNAYLEVFSVDVDGMYVAHAILFDLRNEFERRFFLEHFNLYETGEEFPMSEAREYFIASLKDVLLGENSCSKS